MVNKNVFKHSLLVSNIFDPLTHDTKTLEKLYDDLSKPLRYQSIETRLIRDEHLINKFKSIKSKNQWNTTYWITGEISRAKLNPSSMDETLRVKAVNEIKRMIDLASLTKCDFIGIASGPCEDENKRYDQIDQFQKTILEILEYIQEKSYSMKVVFEPLDVFAHKKNVLGKTDEVYEFLNRFPKDIMKANQLSICWDSAHFALNEEEFNYSINKIAPYISRVHFADAILDKDNEAYGDWHRNFDQKGFMNEHVASSILRQIIKTKVHQEEIYVAVEIREHDASNVWNLEEYSYRFVESAIRGAYNK
ncbi:sugar phosphate isomerase/epimerase [Irregularibacter muris]|uniref:Sugar phosphate isomerase/epimerase n=1 Tax=Irregularibacter muris TaxID=1796619 RepID=A0AAE3HGT7_9FIRM|nr:sugar phosphate isomerase/epimerase [Irregularibacter muris]MCR1899090.1 sugar phosphate isomerase/epimerase [Irregularibacter muris]